MNTIAFLKDQLIETRNFVNRLISEFPEDLWYVIPENTDSNFAWQIGHLLMSQNFHAITVITGRSKKVFDFIPVERYAKLFYGMGTRHRSVEKDLIPVSTLKDQLNRVHEICLNNMVQISDDILSDPLESIPFKHPVARSKYEALSWCFKHEMWHSAEMENIKQALGYPVKWM